MGRWGNGEIGKLGTGAAAMRGIRTDGCLFQSRLNPPVETGGCLVDLPSGQEVSPCPKGTLP